ncbi:helix-turn-helix domain-containing protein [Streptomyces sp. ODS28]|uniref:TetR/AcrR family transcriptional regulator n=1 Tax=Streptomyces sp. ODS28 TaxID=3136688 RepID=UPI0031ECDE62
MAAVTTERGERILDAAGELLLAWGHRRVTIDEIARRAKVGKGTVYLHWKTKDTLLLAVVLRAKVRSQRAQLERMRTGPREVLLSRMLRVAYLDFSADPVLRALYLDDSDILGRLNDLAEAEFAELMTEGHRMLRKHLELLRAHGAVRTDIDVADQQHICMATLSGFLMTEALRLDREPAGAEQRAAVLEHTLHAALETPDAARVMDAAPSVAAEIIALYEHVTELCVGEMQRQLRD